ncbi:MAG: hypothetical protein SOZ22_00525, partial [Ezakiella sp.]|nr:hypothetical protein [Bacillota bacterium]MDY3922819.1 hypothetical protein [Ezakiella sp.]
MKNSKRLLSFLLVFLMMFPIFADTAYAMSSIMSTKDTENELEGRVAGNQEVFEFDSSIINTKEEGKISKEKQASSEAQSSESTVFRSMPQPMRGPQSESDDTTIELTTVGLDNQAFDWSVFPDRSFKITVKWNTNDGKTHVKENFATLTEDGTTTYNVGWPKDGSMTGNVSIVVDFNNNVKIMAVASRPTSTPDGAGIKFSFKVMQLPNTIAEVIYVDPYGNPLNEGLPQDSATMPNVTIDELPDIQDIKLTNKSETLNFRESEDFDEVEANKLANGLTFKVDGKTTGEKVTIDDKDYKLDISEPNPKEQGTIKLAYQADVLVPPVDPKQPDSGTPVPTPEGYVRLTFDANENKANGVKGIFTNDSPYKGKDKSYIDVKEGIQYDNESLTNAIKALTVQGTKDQKEYTQDLQNPWTPEIPTAGAVSTATYNANYKHSIAEEITEAGGLKGIDLAAFVGDTLDSTFWKKGVALADTVTDTEGKLQALLNAATVTDAT